MGNMMRGASDSSKVNTDNPDSAQKGKVTTKNFKTQKCICKVTLFEKKEVKSLSAAISCIVFAIKN